MSSGKAASSALKFTAKYVNRNPRNVELMGYARKPQGYDHQKNAHLKHCIYKVELVQGKSQQVGRLVHHTEGVVVEASTAEPAIAQQLYSRVDTAAALNIGRVLARRCLQSGIHFAQPAASDEQRQHSEHQGAFFTALQEEGLVLKEPETIEQNANTWRKYPVQHTREDKLDELPEYY